jgi:uncharacterized protein involved in exopolysaccharide biosynthesis
MSLHSAQERPAGAAWDEGDEIDLGRYISALGRRWLEIVLVTLGVVALTAAGVWAYYLLTPPLYEATATAAIVRTLTDVRFDERFTTSAEQENLDVNSRRMALIALVNSGSVAQQVIAELGDALPGKLRDPAELLDAVEGEMATVSGGGLSDLINITVRAESPETAAAIANAWARAYVQQVNSVYGQVSDEMLESVGAELAAAQASYAQVQAELENYLAASPLDALMRQSTVISQTLSVMQGADLGLYHDQWLRASGLLGAARAIGEQIGSDENVDVAGTALALQVLKLQMVNAAATLPPVRAGMSQTVELQQSPTTLQLQLDTPAALTPAELRAQVEATIRSLEAQLALLEGSMAQASQALAASIQPAETSASVRGMIAEMEERARALQTEVEIESARALEFTERRDIAWESVQALSSKQAELQLARAAANSEVRLSSVAIPLYKPVEQVSLPVALVLAVLAGLLLGAVTALALEMANVRPLRSPRPAQQGQRAA